MSHGHAIARNAAWLLVATTLQKFIAFLTFTYLARAVGAEVTGQYFFAVSVTSVFVILTDLGLTPVVIREMAQDEQSGRIALGRALRAKLTLIPVAVVASLVYGYLAGTSPAVFLAIALACFVMSADAVSLLWYGALRGKRLLRFEALGMFTGQVVTAVVTVAAVTLRLGPAGLVFGLLCGSTWNVLWSITQARKLSASPLPPPPTPPRAGGVRNWTYHRLALSALPFALAGIFVKIYSYVDTLMLRQFHGEVSVGHYAVAYKITYAFQFLPLAFVAALYPGMSAAYASKEKKELKNILSGSLRLMMLVAVPLSAVLSALAPQIILIYGRQFTGSIQPLTILPWVLIPIFLDFPIGSLLNATHRASKKTTAMGITMVVNVVANALLVPTYGPVGAAWAGVISFWVLFFGGAWFARRDVPSYGWAASLFARGLLAAAAIWYLLRQAADVLPLPMLLLFTGALCLVVLFAVQLCTLNDVRLIYQWARKKAAPADVVEEEAHS